jgi:hypothetical protein
MVMLSQVDTLLDFLVKVLANVSGSTEELLPEAITTHSEHATKYKASARQF